MKMTYPVIIHEEDGAFWTEFPDFSGCFCEEDTLEDVLTESSVALGLYIAAMLDDEQEIPKASDFSMVKPEDGFVSLIVTDPDKYRKKSKAVKKTLTIPEWLNIEAERKGINFSSVLKDALVAAIQ